MKHLIIDVREPDEYALSHAKNAINIPLSQVVQGASELQDVPKDTSLIVYCRSGARAGVAANALKAQGFSNLKNGVNQAQVENDLATD